MTCRLGSVRPRIRHVLGGWSSDQDGTELRPLRQREGPGTPAADAASDHVTQCVCRGAPIPSTVSHYPCPNIPRITWNNQKARNNPENKRE